MFLKNRKIEKNANGLYLKVKYHIGPEPLKKRKNTLAVDAGIATFKYPFATTTTSHVEHVASNQIHTH